MRTKLIGRDLELNLLNKAYNSSRAELTVVYGRRRVGKSYLIKYYGQVRSHLFFEGLEGVDTTGQLQFFQKQLKKQISDPLLQRAKFEDWSDLFDFLTSYAAQNKKGKLVILFDEFQWMAAGQAKLVALVKYFWDSAWKNLNIHLILCGSIASFMVKKVIKSKALYGRLTQQIQVQKLSPSVSVKFFSKKRGLSEILKYILVIGGIPKYLEDIDLNRSFEQNILSLFFNQNALYLDEFDAIFNVHFKEPRTYLKIIKAMGNKTLSLEEIGKAIDLKSSGGLKIYLENLEMAEFIRKVTSYESSISRYPRYRVSDEFSWFYIKFILPHHRMIKEGGGFSLFQSKVKTSWDPWFGFAFENYCINNAMMIAKMAGFENQVESFGPLYKKAKPGVQFDLIFRRTDFVISVCEIKFWNKPLNTEIIPEMLAKLQKIIFPKNYTVERVLIAPLGASEELIKSGFFHNIITLSEFFNS